MVALRYLVLAHQGRVLNSTRTRRGRGGGSNGYGSGELERYQCPSKKWETHILPDLSAWGLWLNSLSTKKHAGRDAKQRMTYLFGLSSGICKYLAAGPEDAEAAVTGPEAEEYC